MNEVIAVGYLGAILPHGFFWGHPNVFHLTKH